MPHLRPHRIALLIALAQAVAAPVQASADTRAPANSAHVQALQDALDEAAQQGEQGDTLGALITFERLLADPGLADIPDADRVNAYVVAGWVALQARQHAPARSYLELARHATPDEPRALYLLGVLDTEDGRHLEGARLITRSLQLSDQFLPDISMSMAGSLGQQLQGHESDYRDFLQALFDQGWKPEAIEPTDFWKRLAVLQIDSGQDDRVASTLERIDSPMAILALRADKRFDRFIDRDSPRFDPLQSAQRELDALRVGNLLAPEEIRNLVEMSYALLALGRHDEVVAMTGNVAGAAADPSLPRSFEHSGDIAWLLNNRAIAQRRLGDAQAGLATLEAAAAFHEEGAANVSQQLNLASWQASLLRPREALETLEKTGSNLSPYGEAVQQWVRFFAYRQLGDMAQAATAQRWLEDHKDIAEDYVVETLLEDNALDQAAAHLVARLRSTEHRSEALMSMQQLLTVPSLPGDAERDHRWRQVVARADVQAALDAVGRSEHHPLFNTGSSR